VDPELFFPGKGGSNIPAKQVCAVCTVRQECLDYAVANFEQHGIWGGLTRDERRSMHGQRLAPMIEHGSQKGYQQHRRRGETPCALCRIANARYHLERRAS